MRSGSIRQTGLGVLRDGSQVLYLTTDSGPQAVWVSPSLGRPELRESMPASEPELRAPWLHSFCVCCSWYRADLWLATIDLTGRT